MATLLAITRYLTTGNKIRYLTNSRLAYNQVVYIQPYSMNLNLLLNYMHTTDSAIQLEPALLYNAYCICGLMFFILLEKR